MVVELCRHLLTVIMIRPYALTAHCKGALISLVKESNNTAHRVPVRAALSRLLLTEPVQADSPRIHLFTSIRRPSPLQKAKLPNARPLEPRLLPPVAPVHAKSKNVKVFLPYLPGQSRAALPHGNTNCNSSWWP